MFFLVGVSQRPQVPREPTPNKLRTNSEQTPNELRTNSERTPNELRTNSVRTPNELRTNSERTPDKLRTNSGRTRNKLRTSEQAPSELWHCSRANSEHTLAISMVLSPSILVAKLFFFFFFGLTKSGQVITGPVSTSGLGRCSLRQTNMFSGHLLKLVLSVT